MARFGVSRLREHRSSGGSLNRNIRNLFMAIIVANVIAVTAAWVGFVILVTLLARREAELGIRTIIMLVGGPLRSCSIC